ncbi:hypothetical protein RW1_066_00270 [Rhodococcus wratislaviensis NBRC 100605]|uniref:Uncharacterized protein n=1 Tax=Rhodococcus wratislaviensis NBRC 100605 TaxID=1219028 RepID=X0RDG0_RHOWR|nr:hypothetical protein RW1_066_00270 [Rhodococcus wratislaviensis NBRC 100605]
MHHLEHGAIPGWGAQPVGGGTRIPEPTTPKDDPSSAGTVGQVTPDAAPGRFAAPAAGESVLATAGPDEACQ